MERYKGVRSAERMFDLIELLNKRRGAKVAELAELSGTSRRSVDRMLTSLVKYGYVRRLETDGRYYLTHLVRRLSEGYREEDWLTDVASPILEELCQEVLWPCDIITYYNGAVYLRDTSRRFSPFSIDWITVGQKFPMMISGAGRAYLTYCPKRERDGILRILRTSDDPFDKPVNQRGYVEKFMSETRHQGYGARCTEHIYDDRTASIAVPIRKDERVLGTIGITGIASAISTEELAAQHLKSLLEKRDKIEMAIADLNPS